MVPDEKNSPCRLHGEMDFKLQDLRERVTRVEKFLLSAILILATSSFVTVLKIQQLPHDIVNYEKTAAVVASSDRR